MPPALAVVPSLLACLGSPVRAVRRAAIAALQTVSGVDGSPYYQVTQSLLQETEELVTDASHVSQVGPPTLACCSDPEMLHKD